MKKIICLALALLMCALPLVACNKQEEETTTLIVGYTDYEPMNYTDENGKLVGFDTELAEAVAEKLDMEIKFQLIEWKNKYLELDSGNINCIWNGFTSNCADDDGVQRGDKVDFSYAYMNNEQCVVVKKANADALNSKAALADKIGTAEGGSAGEGVVKEFLANEKNYVDKTAQMDTFTEVMAGTADFAVVDKTLAKTVVGKGDYADLTIVDAIEIESELYSIGFKKGSDLTAKVNEALKELAADGTMTKLAEKYGLQNYVITDLK